MCFWDNEGAKSSPWESGWRQKNAGYNYGFELSAEELFKSERTWSIKYEDDNRRNEKRNNPDDPRHNTGRSNWKFDQSDCRPIRIPSTELLWALLVALKNRE